MKGYTDEKIVCYKRVKFEHYNMMSKYFSFIYFVWLLVWSLNDSDHICDYKPVTQKTAQPKKFVIK